MLYCTGKEGSKEQKAQTEIIEERKREERKAALVTYIIISDSEI